MLWCLDEAVEIIFYNIYMILYNLVPANWPIDVTIDFSITPLLIKSISTNNLLKQSKLNLHKLKQVMKCWA